jgi:Protein of unknown function (DUF2809)
MLQLNKQHLKTTVILFLIEIFIATFIHDRFIRPFFGDFLVVILIFYFFKSFLKITDWNIAWLSLAISYLVEFFQYIDILNILGLSHNKMVVVIAGNSFAWEDMLAYTLGILFILYYEINFIKYYFPKSDSY